MKPIISVVASKANMGKTTVICQIISDLKKRGYKVATIKHHKGDFEIDYRNKDTWHHYNSGADTVILSSPKKLAKIERREEEYTLDEIASTIENVDIIITEGYKYENKPKIEIIRKEIDTNLISPENQLFAIVANFFIDTKTPQFDFNNIEELVDLIEGKFLK